VGIDRRSSPRSTRSMRSPRARGDRSKAATAPRPSPTFTPRTRGSIADPPGLSSWHLVHPAHAGIDRGHARSRGPGPRSPRARGDRSLGHRSGWPRTNVRPAHAGDRSAFAGRAEQVLGFAPRTRGSI